MLIALALAFGSVLLTTALYLPLARRWRQLDAPNARSAHRRPVPSSGGIAIASGLAVALGYAQWHGEAGLATRELCALSPALLLCLLGALDDRRPLPVGLRLGLFLVLCSVPVMLYLSLPGTLQLLAVPLLSLALGWQLNLFNFMDGIDGLAALQCALVAGALGVLGWLAGGGDSYVLLAVAVAAAYAGFLVFNWPPARLFMGDAGSLSGGYLLGVLGLWGWADGHLHPAIWLLLMSPFLIDTGYTLVVRLLRGDAITQAHSQHIYQRLARRWGSHRRVDLALLLLHGLWLLPLALVAALDGLAPPLVLVIATLPQLVAVRLLMAGALRLQ